VAEVAEAREDHGARADELAQTAGIEGRPPLDVRAVANHGRHDEGGAERGERGPGDDRCPGQPAREVDQVGKGAAQRQRADQAADGQAPVGDEPARGQLHGGRVRPRHRETGEEASG
jgi:hypothetical protein